MVPVEQSEVQGSCHITSSSVDGKGDSDDITLLRTHPSAFRETDTAIQLDHIVAYLAIIARVLLKIEAVLDKLKIPMWLRKGS